MNRIDEDIAHADRELADFVYNCQELIRLYDQIREIDIQLNNYGISSPKIMSLEEAKYQKGTKIYSDVPLLELIAKQDDLVREYVFLTESCSRVKKKLIRMDLNSNDLMILYYRYERHMICEHIANVLGYSRTGIQYRLDVIRELYNKV